MKGVARLELERGTDGRAPVDTPMVPKERDGHYATDRVASALLD